MEKSQIEKVKELLLLEGSPKISTTPALKIGYALCIKPVKPVCSGQIICHPDTKGEILDIMGES